MLSAEQERARIVAWLRADETWKDVVNLTWAISNGETYRVVRKIALMIENGTHETPTGER